MQTYYGKLLGYKCWKDNVEIVREFENEYPSVNIFLNRNGLTYQETGRFQSKEEAIKIDNELIKFISDSKVINNLVEYESVDLHGIMDYISTELTLRR